MNTPLLIFGFNHLSQHTDKDAPYKHMNGILCGIRGIDMAKNRQRNNMAWKYINLVTKGTISLIAWK